MRLFCSLNKTHKIRWMLVETWAKFVKWWNISAKYDGCPCLFQFMQSIRMQHPLSWWSDWTIALVYQPYVLDDFCYDVSRIFAWSAFAATFFCRTGSMSYIMQTCSTNNKECNRLTPGGSGGGLLPRSSAPLLTERLLIMLPQACCDWMLPSKPTCQCETGSPWPL